MRIAGIDIGSSTVKLVEMDTAFGRYELRGYRERNIVDGESPWATTAALIQSLEKKPEKIALALSSRQTTFRNLPIPTRDKKIIQSAVMFELEDDLPFDLNSAISDYTVLSQTGKETHVHIAITLKKHMAQLLADANEHGIDPDLVTTEAWAYRTLFNRVLNRAVQENPVLLIQTGRSQTTLFVQWRGFPVYSRTVMWGARDLIHIVAQRYQVPESEAEHLLHENGFVLPPAQRAKASTEQIVFSDLLLSPLSKLMKEIRQTDLSCKNITHQHLGTIYLSGGLALLPGLRSMIEEEMDTQTFQFQGLSAITTTGATYPEHDDYSCTLAAALALALGGPDRGAALNLRRGDFAKVRQTREMNWANIKGPLTGTSLVLGCLMLSVGIRSSIYQRNLEELDTQFEKSVRAFFGSASKNELRIYMSDREKLKKNVTRELTRARAISKILGTNPRSPIDFLKEISRSITRSTVVDMIHFSAGSSPEKPYDSDAEAQASLSFLLNTPETADKLSQQLSNSIEHVTQGKMEEAPAATGEPKKWKVTFSGKIKPMKGD